MVAAPRVGGVHAGQAGGVAPDGVGDALHGRHQARRAAPAVSLCAAPLRIDGRVPGQDDQGSQSGPDGASKGWAKGEGAS